jgi:hypothetical protein
MEKDREKKLMGLTPRQIVAEVIRLQDRLELLEKINTDSRLDTEPGSNGRPIHCRRAKSAFYTLMKG